MERYKFQYKSSLGKQPSAELQWKGTDVCMDLYCVCGEPTHLDCEFVYFFKCSKCGRIYEMDPTIKMIEVPKEWYPHIEAEWNPKTGED